jgi:RNA polymerase sigma factor (sigma-70 family)
MSVDRISSAERTMSTSGKISVLQDLDRLFRHGVSALGDGALVHRFLSEGNELAFQTLIERHGPMVRGVCNRLLSNTHDADDAFQATFLVLARKARQLRDPDRVGPWLYGVARRVASKARTRSQRHCLEPLVEVCAHDDTKAEWLDVMPIVDDELGRLPAKQRDVLVLCLLNGASPQEAAVQMGCPVGTVKSRLARARDALRGRLETRGIAPAVALAIASSSDAFASPVSPALIHSTLELLVGSTIAPGVLSLTRGALPNMMPRSILISSVVVGGLAIAGLGAANWLGSSTAQEPGNAAEGRNGLAGERGQQTLTNNMKQILLAFHNYQDINGRFPATANYGADGLPKLSWRVALLPFLAENDLYNEFHQDEPWDSPHNYALLGKMPSVFQTPGSPGPAGHTRIQGFVGKGAMFEGVEGISFREVPDGTSNTAMIAVARDAVPWTRPADLAFAEKAPLPALDERNPLGFELGMADGSVRALSARVDAKFLRSIITRAGGEVIEWPAQESDAPTERQIRAGNALTTRQVASGLMPTPAPAAVPDPLQSAQRMMMVSMTLEQRVQRVEEKLDRLIERLDRILPEVPAKRH